MRLFIENLLPPYSCPVRCPGQKGKNGSVNQGDRFKFMRPLNVVIKHAIWKSLSRDHPLGTGEESCYYIIGDIS